jgi:diguanylate cyclase (GGDEF)-like protein
MRIAREDRLVLWSSCFAVAAADGSAAIGDSWNADRGYGRHDEWHDPVTGLPRPRCFLEHLERLLAKPDRHPQSLAMLLLEVTDFDLLRTRLGTPWCDELLRTIAERLHEEVPEPNLVTRLRGGAFAIVLHDLGSEVAPEALADRLLERASEPCPSGDPPLRWEVVGALAVPGDRAATAMQLFDHATRALDRAKLRRAGQPPGDLRRD